MEVSYLSDIKGRKTAVVIPIKKWNSLKKKHQDLALLEEDEPTKEEILDGIREGFREMKDILDGKKEGRPIEELLNEL